MDSDYNIKQFKEILFIYNAISHGWTVKKINKDTYKFYRKGVNVNLETFVNKNLDITNIFK